MLLPTPIFSFMAGILDTGGGVLESLECGPDRMLPETSPVPQESSLVRVTGLMKPRKGFTLVAGDKKGGKRTCLGRGGLMKYSLR